MAQASTFTLSSSSEQVTLKENVADKIFELFPADTPLITMVGMDSLPTPCHNVTYKYNEIQERPARSTLNGAINNSTTTVVFDDAIYLPSEIVQVDEELILLGTTSDNLTFASCTRSHGTGAAAAHLDEAPTVSLGKPQVQGSAGSDTGDLAIQPNAVTNYAQIWKKQTVVSGTVQAQERYGVTGTEDDYQLIRHGRTIKKEMQNALIWGVAVAPSTTATAGEMDGIYERIQSTQVTDLSDAAYTISNCETAVETTLDYGAMLDLTLCGLYTKRVIDSWGQSYINHPTNPLDPINMQFGTVVSRLTIGGSMQLVFASTDLHAHVLHVDTSKVGFGPYRPMIRESLAKDGDRIKTQIVGEYTSAVATPRAHYMFSSVKFA
jgi:hypothetical protein